MTRARQTTGTLSLVDRVVARVYTARGVYRYASAPDEAAATLDHLLSELQKYAAWGKSFPATLARAEKADGLPPGLVWQTEFVAFWQPFDAIQKEMFELSDDLQSILEDSGRSGLWRALEDDLDPPRDAQLEFAMGETVFIDVAGSRSRIAYPIERLEAWHRNFSRWVGGAIRNLRALSSKV